MGISLENIPVEVVEAVTELAERNADDFIRLVRDLGVDENGRQNFTPADMLTTTTRHWLGRANAVGLLEAVPFDPVTHDAVREAAAKGDLVAFQGFDPADIAAVAMAFDMVSYATNLTMGIAAIRPDSALPAKNLSLMPLFPECRQAGALPVPRPVHTLATSVKSAKRGRNHVGPVDLTKPRLTEKEAAAALGVSRRWLAEKRFNDEIPAALFRRHSVRGNVFYITKLLLLWIEDPVNKIFMDTGTGGQMNGQKRRTKC